jgi:outer membrane PBP1 activator LpoA protein
LFHEKTIQVAEHIDSAEHYQIELAKVFYLRREYEKTLTLLNRLDFDRLSVSEQTDFALLQGRTALKQGNGSNASYWLAGQYTHLFDGLSLPDQISIGLLRADAWAISGDFYSAARERIYLNPLLNSDQQVINQEVIWLNLITLPTQKLAQLSQLPIGNSLSGWLDLAYLFRSNESDPVALQDAYEAWKTNYPLHEASSLPPSYLINIGSLIQRNPTDIALFLPMSGNYADAGQAITRGFLANYYNSGNSSLNISLIDTHNQDVRELYQQALADGIDFIVGPLLKSDLQKLQELELSIPVLGLNRLPAESEYQALLYQFALAPEDEAQQAAQVMRQLGYESMAILRPDTAYGDRVSAAALREWNALGGELASEQSFKSTDDGRHYLAISKALLGIAESEKRSAELDYLLDSAFEFEPYRRKDIDWILLAATPEQARTFKPILNFQYAEDIPVLSLTTAFEGQQQEAKNAELDGLQILTLPWYFTDAAIKQELESIYPSLAGSNANLVAMGADAFDLIPRLSGSQASELRLQGHTGLLELDLSNRIRRSLPSAEFANGLVSLKSSASNE